MDELQLQAHILAIRAVLILNGLTTEDTLNKMAKVAFEDLKSKTSSREEIT